MTQADFYEAHRARLDAFEPTYVPKVRRALLRSIERCVLALEAGATPAVAASFVDPAPIQRVLQALYVAAGVPEAAITYDQLTPAQKALAPPATIGRWTDRLRRFLLTEGAAAVRGITATTRRIVSQALFESVAAGEGVAVAARRLRARVTQLAPARAVAIVRTELVAAGNQGSLLGAQATGVKLEKFWISTKDSRTRQSHAAANGQGAPLQDGFFLVGGEHCRYPADPMLSAGERARCRCAVGYRAPRT